MAVVKSKLLKQLSKNYPNFLKKDLEKFSNIILEEIKKHLREVKEWNLEVLGCFLQRFKKQEYQEIQKLVKK